MTDELGKTESYSTVLAKELDRCHDMETKRNETLKELRKKLELVEEESTEFAKFHAQVNSTVNQLQSDNEQLRKRTEDLQNKLSTHLEEKQEIKNTAVEWKRKYEGLQQMINQCVCLDTAGGNKHDDATIIEQLKERLQDQTRLKVKIIKLENDLESVGRDANLERELRKTMLTQLDHAKEQLMAVDILKQEKDSALQQQKMLEDAIKKTEELLVRKQDQYENCQRELQSCQSKLADTETTLRLHATTTQAAASEFRSFKESLSKLLSPVSNSVNLNEESIKEKINELLVSRARVDIVNQNLGQKIQELSKQLEEQVELYKNAVERCRDSEKNVELFNERLSYLDGEMNEMKLTNESLRTEKEKYSNFCQQLARVMKLDKIANELGMELNGDSLLTRAEQLTNIEVEQITEKRSHSMQVGKQLMEMRQQLDSKDLQLSMLKKKLTVMENEQSHKAEQDLHDILERNGRLKKTVETLETKLKERNQQAKQVETVGKLENICKEQSQTIGQLQTQLARIEPLAETKQQKVVTVKTDETTPVNCNAVEEEIQRFKQQLDAGQLREKQLLDFRSVIARMLGLNSHTLAIPDYEIVRRLETLLDSQNSLYPVASNGKNESLKQGRGQLSKSNTPMSKRSTQ